MAAGMPIDYFIKSVFSYPTLAECYKVAAPDGANRARASGSGTSGGRVGDPDVQNRAA